MCGEQFTEDMIVTLDGPAGAGKSTIAKALARRLGFAFLDTGAMYRAVTLAALQEQADWNDARSLAELARRSQVEVDANRVFLNGEDVSEAIRSTEVTTHIHFMADNPDVRQRLVELQRAYAAGHDIVTEGRDQGTVVFPDAQCKIFLTASAEERARRRLQDLQGRGESPTLQEVLQQQTDRDHRDASRQVGRLEPAPDAIEFVTDGMTADQVLDQLLKIVRERALNREDG